MPIVEAIPKLVTVFGGSGFVGRHVVRALARRGYRVRVAVRRPDLAGFVQPAGNVGQVQPVQANIRVRWSIDRAVQGSDYVINLVGIAHESGRQTFAAVQDFGARAIAESAHAAGVGMTQISAIGANGHSESDYARSKAAGETAVRATLPGATIIRPSMIFGPEDQFFNRFANMARFSPVLPIVGAETKFQPVYVGDVAEVIARSVDGKMAGAVYELGGPEVLSFRECMDRMLTIIERRRVIANVPWPVASLMGSVLGILPKPPITSDQVEMLRHDNVVSHTAREARHTLEGLGIEARSIDAILPAYLWTYRVAGQFTNDRLA